MNQIYAELVSPGAVVAPFLDTPETLLWFVRDLMFDDDTETNKQTKKKKKKKEEKKSVLWLDSRPVIDFWCMMNQIYAELVSPGAVVAPFLDDTPETLLCLVPDSMFNDDTETKIKK